MPCFSIIVTIFRAVCVCDHIHSPAVSERIIINQPITIFDHDFVCTKYRLVLFSAAVDVAQNIKCLFLSSNTYAYERNALLDNVQHDL